MSGDVVAVTGAGGFIGRAFCVRAAAGGRMLRRFVRAPENDADGVVAIDLAQAGVDEMTRHLEGVATVVHLAGRAHVMDAGGRESEAAYRAVNELATARLAQAALVAGVRRFVFASTVKVNGESTPAGQPFLPGDAPAPQDAYARSKLAAESALLQAARDTPMSAVVLRLPLVHGPGARGNFRRLVDAVRAEQWLPFGAIDNRRSVIGLDNLLDVLEAAIDAPSLGGVHFVADADSVSTPQLVRAVARALRTKPRLVPVPVALLRLAGAVAGRRDAIARLTCSLEVDTASFATATGWRPRAFAIDAAEVTGSPVGGLQQPIIEGHE